MASKSEYVLSGVNGFPGKVALEGRTLTLQVELAENPPKASSVEKADKNGKAYKGTSMGTAASSGGFRPIGLMIHGQPVKVNLFVGTALA